MSELRSVLDQMAAVASEDLTIEEIDAEIEAITQSRQRLDVLLAERLASLSDRGGHVVLGYSSPTAYLADRGRLSVGRATQSVAMSRAKHRAPHAFSAWSDGRISTDQATALFRTAQGVPDAYPEAEERLVMIIEGLNVRDTRKAVEYWRQSVDSPGDLDLDVQLGRRCFHLSETIGGMRRVDGWLTAAAGEALEASIDALVDPPREGDDRTARQRRHDALENLCRDWLDHADTPQSGGEKPHIMVLTDLDALAGIGGGTHETLNGDVIDIDTLRMLACDCSVSRIVLGPDSEVLDVGRKTRVWTPAQRRAIIARDRTCQAPGCDTKPRYCDIHHKDHWADGGVTSVDNGKLLCRHHHTQEHLRDNRRRGRPRT